MDTFGVYMNTSSPAWSIPTAQRFRYKYDDNPPPGLYDIPPEKIDIPTKISPRPRVRDETITSNIVIPNIRLFPAVKPMTIGRRKDLVFYPIPDSPPPSYLPPSTLTKRGHKIVNRSVSRKNTNPGPGDYTPRFQVHIPSTTLPKTSRRVRHMEPGPGPCDYSPRYSSNRIYPSICGHARKDIRYDDE